MTLNMPTMTGVLPQPMYIAIFRWFLDKIPEPRRHIAHFHETKRVASASILAALQAGIIHF